MPRFLHIKVVDERSGVLVASYDVQLGDRKWPWKAVFDITGTS